MKILHYENANNLTIQFEDGTQVCSRYSDFKIGNIANPNFISVRGIGYMGIGEYNSKKRAYEKWNKMLDRCYNEDKRNKFPTYKDVIVCEEWHNFQNFAKWYENNLWNENFDVLDKDILFKGNKIYSPKTCCLVDQRINSLFCKVTASRGNCPIGVHLRKDNKKFYAKCSIIKNGNYKAVYLGHYETPEEAFNVYKIFKESYIKQVADEYKTQYSNFPQNLYEAMYKYKVEITD